MEDRTQSQLELTERLQDKLLRRFETLLDEGTITSTDMATLTRLLLMSGWNLDRAKIPQSLQAKLTTHLDPEDFSDEAHLKLA
jgi:hypothetical protein